MLKPRTLMPNLQRLAQQYPVVTLTGPRQSGKTTLCQQAFQNHAYVSLEDLSARQYAKEDPNGFLARFNDGVILDEIQRTPELPSYIQEIVDKNQKPGQFILTGSQQFEVTHTINQSLAGRTAVLRLLPFSYSELYSKQDISINRILYRGFYPRIFQHNLNPTEALSFYVNTYVERDIRNLIYIKHLSVFERFLKICASQIGRLTNYSRLANDCGVTQNTIKEWLSVLEASYIIFQLQPHFENFRKRLTKSSKIYFYDVGLAAYLLGISSEEHIESHPLRGELFENFIITEFLKNQYNNVKPNNLYFYRDNVGHEVDLILDKGVEINSIEIKLSKTFSPNFTAGLDFYHALSKEKNTQRMVIYGGHESFQFKQTKIYAYSDLDVVFSTPW